MINAAVIGLGNWGRQIIRSVQGKSTSIRIVRGVDIAVEAAGEFAAAHGLTLSADYQDALDDPEIDGVILTTPHSLHEEHVARAVAAGKHPFCEKPLSLTRASAASMVALCADAGLVLGVGHERRYEPASEEIRRLINDGTLGTIMHVEAHCSHDLMRRLAADHWRASPAEAPAAGMTGMGVHLTDLLISLIGPISEVYAHCEQRVLPLPNGDVVSVQLKFADSTTGVMADVSATPFYSRIAVFGDGGWVEARDDAYVYEGTGTELTVRTANGESQRRTLATVDTVRLNVEAWADAIEGRGTYRFSQAELIQNVAILEAIAKSAETGLPQAVPR